MTYITTHLANTHNTICSMPISRSSRLRKNVPWDLPAAERLYWARAIVPTPCLQDHSFSNRCRFLVVSSSSEHLFITEFKEKLLLSATTNVQFGGHLAIFHLKRLKCVNSLVTSKDRAIWQSRTHAVREKTSSVELQTTIITNQFTRHWSIWHRSPHWHINWMP